MIFITSFASDNYENENWHNNSTTEDATSVGKFQWEETILKCLQAASDNELSMKKLKKKVQKYSS